MEQLPRHLYSFLISTTSRLVGVFDSPSLRIDHAWPMGSPSHIRRGIEQGPHSRNYFVISIKVSPPERETVIIPNYNYVSDEVCVALSILYGKRFDNHGSLISDRDYCVPENTSYGPSHFPDAAPYNHCSREEGNVDLRLERFSVLAPLFLDENVDEKHRRFILSAGRLYLRSLRVFDQEPEFAYLDLITCGEVLANFYDYTLDELLDGETVEAFRAIRERMDIGDVIVKQLSGRMRQIKRSYTVTLLRLLSSKFFEGADVAGSYRRLEVSGIEQRIKASYDLRSKYVHSGINFGYLFHHNSSEVLRGRPVLSDSELVKILIRAPTYFGMERIIRYCLLRFIHLNGIAIDASLDGPGLSDS